MSKTMSFVLSTSVHTPYFIRHYKDTDHEKIGNFDVFLLDFFIFPVQCHVDSIQQCIAAGICFIVGSSWHNGLVGLYTVIGRPAGCMCVLIFI